MVHIKPFWIEQYMESHETKAIYNLAETCSDSMSLSDLESLGGSSGPIFAPGGAMAERKLAYGHIRGSPELRENIAKLYSPSNPLPAERVLIQNGAIGANFTVLYTLVNPGDHVICVHPTYQALYDVPTALGAEVSLLELKEEQSYKLDVDVLNSLIRTPDADGKGGTSLIIINNPNNPTGATHQIESIIGLAAPHKIPILSDEVYRPLFHSYSDPVPSIVDLYDHGIATGSLSKAYALAGIRVGWIASQNLTFIEQFAAARDYNTISVSQLDDAVAAYTLQSSVVEKVLERNMQLCKTNLRILESFIERSEGRLSWVKPTAGTTTLVKVTKNGMPVNDVKFCEGLLEKTGAYVVPAGLCFGDQHEDQLKGYFRIGYACNTQVLEQGLAKMEEFLKEGDY